MKKSFLVGIAYGFVHFTVEVVSFYFLYSIFGDNRLWWLIALAYDALAFVPQNIYGIISDKYLKLNVSLIGAIMMSVALIMENGIVALVFLTSGNALIHIGGAQHTLRVNEKKILPNAIFVGAGSFGVITGQLLGKSSSKAAVCFIAILMMLSVIIICTVQKYNSLDSKSAHIKINSEKNVLLIVISAFVSVSIRGYIAYAIPMEWKKTVVQTVLLFVFMGIGKILGGVFADSIGYRRTSYISLLGGLPFLLLGNQNMLLSLVGVSLFSMTMPITVAILVSVFNKQTGFAFGVTTLGLFVGTLPSFFIVPKTLIQQQLVVVSLTFIALLLMNICIRKENEYENLFT